MIRPIWAHSLMCNVWPPSCVAGILYARVQGLLPLYIHPQTGDATTQMVSLGAMGDSYYEYLLKVWIYKGRRKEDDMYRGMWERSMDEMLAKLLFKNEESGYTYVAEFAR